MFQIQFYGEIDLSPAPQVEQPSYWALLLSRLHYWMELIQPQKQVKCCLA